MSTTTPRLGASFVIALLTYVLHWLIKFKNQIRSIVAGPGLHLSCSSSGLPERSGRSSPGAKSWRRNSSLDAALAANCAELLPLDAADALSNHFAVCSSNPRVKKPIRPKVLSLGAQLIERF